jgi:hypothetical protein
MVRRIALSLVVVATLAGASAAFGQGGLQVPSPDLLLNRAWEEAGGLETYGRLGILLVEVTAEENTQEGTITGRKSRTYFLAPGPAPGRIEIEKPPVVSGDDGTGGWAIAGGKPDARPSTKMMVKRLLTTNLFTIMLPFSLNWEGVTAVAVEPMVVKGIPVWRLFVDIAPGFFHSPQISPKWRVDFDRTTYAVVQADCPATDLGKGITADGMRISWTDHRQVMGLRLPGVQRTIGISETGAEKAHSRTEQLRYEVMSAEAKAKLFGNPVPPELRPTPPSGRPPVAAPKPKA